jgi:hypothetical protein
MSPRRRDCLPASSSHPLLLSTKGAAGASRRRELRARAPPPHIEKKGRRRPWAAAHPAVGARGGASGRGGAHHRQRRVRQRPSLPVEEICLLEKKKKGRERNGGRLTLSSVVEDEASDFFSSLRTSESKHYRFTFPRSRHLLSPFSIFFFARSWRTTHKAANVTLLCRTVSVPVPRVPTSHRRPPQRSRSSSLPQSRPFPQPWPTSEGH